MESFSVFGMTWSPCWFEERGSSGLMWGAPPKAGEAREVRIVCDPLAAVLDRHSRVICVGDQPSRRPGSTAQSDKDVPVSWTWSYEMATGPASQLVDERERLIQCRWAIEDPRIRHDAHEPLEHQFREGEWLVAVGEFRQPLRVFCVLPGVLTMRVNEHVHVRREHWQSEF